MAITNFNFQNYMMNPFNKLSNIGEAMTTLMLVFEHDTRGFVPVPANKTKWQGRPIAKCDDCRNIYFDDFSPPNDGSTFSKSNLLQLWMRHGQIITERMISYGEKFFPKKPKAKKTTVCPICWMRDVDASRGPSRRCGSTDHLLRGYDVIPSLVSDYSGCPLCVAQRWASHTRPINSPGSQMPQLGTFGSPNRKFPRAVGFEIETGSIGSSNNQSIQQHLQSGTPACWHIINHHDGSLDAGGIEYVTPALLGDEVEKTLDYLYTCLKDRKLSIEHVLAGAHIHVDARDLYRKFIQVDNITFRKLVKNHDAKEWNRHMSVCSEIKNDMMEAMKDYFRRSLLVCRLFISERRRTNTYCRESFGIRSGAKPWMRGQYPGNGYCGIAIRENTLEFRLWPSTNSLKNHVARAELSCKIVQYLAKMPINKWGTTAEGVPDGRKAVKSGAYYDSEIVPWLATIGVSDESIRELSRIAKKYRNAKNDKDPTTIREQVLKEIPDPEVLDKMTEAIKKNETYKHALTHKTPEQLLAHPHTTFGDTMIWVPELCMYFDLETFEPVPNVGSGGYRYRM